MHALHLLCSRTNSSRSSLDAELLPAPAPLFAQVSAAQLDQVEVPHLPGAAALAEVADAMEVDGIEEGTQQGQGQCTWPPHRSLNSSSSSSSDSPLPGSSGACCLSGCHSLTGADPSAPAPPAPCACSHQCP
jgi:hypothetical protein